MKFVINGDEYDGVSLERVTGRHAMDLAKYAKVGVAQVATRIEEMHRLAFDEDDNVIVLPEDDPAIDQEVAGMAVFASEPHLKAMLAMVWMSWRLNGDDKNLPWAAVEDYPILTLRVVNDDEVEEGEVEEGEDPTPPSASAPVADGEARPSRRTSKGSTTSKRTSRRGS